MRTAIEEQQPAQRRSSRAGSWSRTGFTAVAGSFALLVASLGGIAAGEPAAAPSPAGLGCEQSVSTPIPQPTQAELDAAGLGDLPLAPDSARRDLVATPFSDPTSVTNPLFPVGELDSAVLNGHVDGKVFHTETTLLPFTQIVEWTPGQCVRVLVSQYMGFFRADEARTGNGAGLR